MKRENLRDYLELKLNDTNLAKKQFDIVVFQQLEMIIVRVKETTIVMHNEAEQQKVLVCR